MYGGLAALGLFAVNRYTRSPAKRLYGQLALGTVFASYAYRTIMWEDTRHTVTRHLEDKDLAILWRRWWRTVEYEKKMEFVKGKDIESFLYNFYWDVRFTETEKRLISVYNSVILNNTAC